MSSSATSQPMILHLGIARGVPSTRLAQLLAVQREQAPEVSVRVHEVSAGELRAGLLEGCYDVGLSLTDETDVGLRSQPLWRERMVAVLPAGFPLMAQGDLSLDDLLQFSVLRWSAEACDALEQRISVLGGRRDAIQQVTSFELMALLVAAGYGVGVAAESRVAKSQAWGVAACPMGDGPFDLTTWLLRHGGQPDPMVEQFTARVLQVAGAL